MPTQIFFNGDKSVVEVTHEPGNMTRYVGTAHKGLLRENTWLVAFPDFGASCFIEEGQLFDWGYISEKLGMRRTGYKLGKSDISEMAKMVAMMVPHTRASTITDETGHILPEHAHD